MDTTPGRHSAAPDSQTSQLPAPPAPLRATVKRTGPGEHIAVVDGEEVGRYPQRHNAFVELCSQSLARQHAIVAEVQDGAGRIYYLFDVTGNCQRTAPPPPAVGEAITTSSRRTGLGADAGESPKMADWVQENLLNAPESAPSKRFRLPFLR